MTREESIAILDGFKHNPLFNGQHFEALDMAISALSDYDKMQEISLDLAFENDELINKSRWIPVSERLPEKFSFVNCTCHSLIDDREDWVVETLYVPQPSNSPYSDWGNIPMLNDKECEVIAWVYREIPEPYKAER